MSSTSWLRINEQLRRQGGPPIYTQLTSLLREEIRAGRLPAGTHIPAQRDLCQRWGLGEGTVRRALQALGEEGLLVARPGSGTFVTEASVQNPDANRSPASQQITRIAVAFANLAHGYPFFRPFLAGLRDGLEPVAVQLFDVPPQTRAWPSPSREAIDGLIMMSPAHPEVLAWSHRANLPTVLLFNDLADGASHCLMPNFASGLTEAVEHLTAAGRSKIAIVTAATERFSTGRWLTAYRSVLRAKGLTLHADWEIAAAYTERDGAQAMRDLLAMPDRPDAVLFASDVMARGGLAVAQDAGLRVPEDIAIVGAGPLEQPGDRLVSLASIDLGLHEMGRFARHTLLAARSEPDTPVSRRAIDSRFVPGDTA